MDKLSVKVKFNGKKYSVKCKVNGVESDDATLDEAVAFLAGLQERLDAEAAFQSSNIKRAVHYIGLAIEADDGLQ